MTPDPFIHYPALAFLALIVFGACFESTGKLWLEWKPDTLRQKIWSGIQIALFNLIFCTPFYFISWEERWRPGIALAALIWATATIWAILRSVKKAAYLKAVDQMDRGRDILWRRSLAQAERELRDGSR